MYDQQLDDIAEATEFLRKWQLAIKERLTDADRKMAEQSKILRLANFNELRRNNVKINTDKLQGRNPMSGAQR